MSDTVKATLVLPKEPPLFKPGNIYATPGVMAATTTNLRSFRLYCHLTGDWGYVCAEDKALNDEALKTGGRILSAYPIDPGKPCKGHGANTFWIITEADRSATTFLLPDEY